jgi:signal transduction histidine kinase
MPTGGRISLITGFYPRRSDEICITIKDFGTGIPLSEIEKVFRPFYTTKTDGVGLGLSLAHRIVEAHGGSIWVCKNPCHDLITKPVELILGSCRSTPSGATIHIRLPLNGVPK